MVGLLIWEDQLGLGCFGYQLRRFLCPGNGLLGARLFGSLGLSARVPS